MSSVPRFTAPELLAEDNLCGHTLLQLVASGSAIIAELLRLSQNVPDIFWGEDEAQKRGIELDAEQRRYLPVLFDFKYLRDPEDHENKLNASTDLLDADTDFIEAHEMFVRRVYALFLSIVKYHGELSQFVERLNSGYFIAHTVENVLQDVEGKQMLCEAFFLYGTMLLLLEARLPGPLRERIVISCYRNQGESALDSVDEVCRLVRATGYLPPPPKVAAVLDANGNIASAARAAAEQAAQELPEARASVRARAAAPRFPSNSSHALRARPAPPPPARPPTLPSPLAEPLCAALDQHIVRTMISRLQSDDVYLQSGARSRIRRTIDPARERFDAVRGPRARALVAARRRSVNAPSLRRRAQLRRALPRSRAASQRGEQPAPRARALAGFARVRPPFPPPHRWRRCARLWTNTSTTTGCAAKPSRVALER